MRVVLQRDQTAPRDRLVAPEQASYYQCQQRKYGRGRRGSTSFAGALADLLCDTGPPSDETVSDVADEGVGRAVATARQGDAGPLCELALRMGVHLRELQKDRLVSVPL